MDLSRIEKVFGDIAVLKTKHVAVFGIGGVGGYTAEALVRGGIGEITIVDGDVVEESNINRQLVATSSTVGMSKTDVMASRLLDINPKLIIHPINKFFLSRNDIDLSAFDMVADAIDTVSAKLELAAALGDRVISCMGTGNRMDATSFKVGDIFEVSGCPLAKIMRNRLRKMNINKLKVVYSTELPVKNSQRTPGSASFVPGVAGLILAGEIIKELLKSC